MNEPLTVLVVDDENPIREELKAIPWAEAQAALIGEARNGEEALALCRARTPDVVITDISMPVLDGLALVRRLRAEMPATQVILLTCHSDFQFAREGLQLGALDYILKVTMTEGQLLEAVTRAREAIEKERAHRGRLRLRERRQQGRALRRLAEAGDAAARDQAARELAEAGVSWRYPVTAALLRMGGSEQDVLFAGPEALAEADRLLLADPLCRCLVPYGADGCVIVREQDGGASGDAPHWAEALRTAVNAGIEERFPFLRTALRFDLLVTGPIREAAALGSALRQLEREAALRLFYDDAPGVWTGPAGREATELPAQALAEALQRERERYPGAADFIREGLGAYALANRPQPDALKRALLQCRASWLPQREAAELAAGGQRLLQAATLAELVEELRAEAEPSPRLRYEIALAQQLVAERLAGEVTVAHVAEAVGLRDHYFSRLFRQEMGEAFGDYVLRMRMEKAVQLLRSSNLKVYEVAEAVGIPNYRYFSVLFRKWTGVTPSDYKKG